jgi:hypothetical protein
MGVAEFGTKGLGDRLGGRSRKSSLDSARQNYFSLSTHYNYLYYLQTLVERHFPPIGVDPIVLNGVEYTYLPSALGWNLLWTIRQSF